jgi:hypothetical protein
MLARKTVSAIGVLLLLAACQSTQSGGNEGQGIGVVYMHGKGGQPNDGSSRALISNMRSYGVTVITPKMPWAGRKGEPQYSVLWKTLYLWSGKT